MVKNKDYYRMLIANTLAGLLLYAGVLYSQDVLIHSVYFSKTIVSGQKTIHITSHAIGADKTICINKHPVGADKTYLLSENPSIADRVFDVVESTDEADQIFYISPTAIGADKTIYITDHPIGADKHICISRVGLGVDEIICIKDATQKEKETIIALYSLGMIMPVSNNDIKAGENWSIYEESTINGNIQGRIRKGYIFETMSGNLYEVSELISMYEYEYHPIVVVLQQGAKYKLIIDGIDDPIECAKLNSGDGGEVGDVIKSSVDGEFEGFEGDTIIKLLNGQIWKQTEYYYEYMYSYMPSVLIYKSGAGYKMKVDGIEKSIGVEKIN